MSKLALYRQMELENPVKKRTVISRPLQGRLKIFSLHRNLQNKKTVSSSVHTLLCYLFTNHLVFYMLLFSSFDCLVRIVHTWTSLHSSVLSHSLWLHLLKTLTNVLVVSIWMSSFFLMCNKQLNCTVLSNYFVFSCCFCHYLVFSTQIRWLSNILHHKCASTPHYALFWQKPDLHILSIQGTLGPMAYPS